MTTFTKKIIMSRKSFYFTFLFLFLTLSFTTGCTSTNVDDEIAIEKNEYKESEISITYSKSSQIDKTKSERPGNQGN